MRIYKYIAKNLDGKILRGLYEANDFLELLEFVKNKGYYLLSFKYNDNKNLIWNKSKISYEIISLFCNQFKTALQAGLTILETLHILSFQCNSKLLRENLKYITEEIKRGRSLYVSLESCPNSFPTFLCQMIRIGEESGKLDIALEHLYNFYYKEYKLKKKISGAMFYPIIVFIVTLISILILLTTVVPSISSVLVSMGVKLPIVTRIIISASDIMKGNIILVIAMIPITAFNSYLVVQYGKQSLVINNMLMKAPLIGKVHRSLIEMKLSRTLSMLLGGGINILRAHEVLVEVNRNTFLERKLKLIISDIRGGHSLAESMANTKFFSQFIVSLVGIGEETGNLEDMLEKASIILEENLQSDINKLTELIQPLMLLIVSGIIGGVILSIMLPIFDVASAL